MSGRLMIASRNPLQRLVCLCFSSRSRHTSCAFVTGVQTCALPIAVSHWEKLAVIGSRSLLRFRPETGRTHQLRVHALEGLGFPIAGDPVYGRGGAKDRTLLHAERLVVARDVKPPVVAEAPFPDRFAALGFAAPEGAEPTRG